MIAIVRQGKSEARVDVSDSGISIADVVCTALGYASIQLEGVIVIPGTNATPYGLDTFEVSYQIGKSGLFHSSVTLVRDATSILGKA